MMLSLDRIRLTVPERVMTRVVDDTTVLVDIDTGRSFTLDAIGTRVWTLLTTAASAQIAYDALLVEYRADPDQVRTDLGQMIDVLAANHLLDVQNL